MLAEREALVSSEPYHQDAAALDARCRSTRRRSSPRPRPAAASSGEVALARRGGRAVHPQPRSPPPPRSSGSPFIREVPKKGLPRRPLPVYADRNSTHRIAAHTGVTGVRLPRPQGRQGSAHPLLFEESLSYRNAPRSPALPLSVLTLQFKTRRWPFPFVSSSRRLTPSPKEVADILNVAKRN